MKNLHYLKKFVVMVLAAMMTLSTFALPTFAAASTTLTVKGVDSGATVKGYQVVEQKTGNVWGMTSTFGEEKYLKADGTETTATDEAGTKTWVVKGTLIPYDFENPSDAALLKLAEIARKEGVGKADVSFTEQTNGDYTAASQKTPGSYIVLVYSNTSTTIYNPMLVSVNPDGAGVKSPDTNNVVDAAGSATVYAKKSDIPFEKGVERNGTLKDSNVNNANTNGDGLENGTGDNNKDGISTNTTYNVNKGDTAGSKLSGDDFVGDVVWFRINTKVPAFTDDYFAANLTKRPQFNVYDKLSKGLTLDGTSIVVKAGGKDIKADEKTDGKSYITITPVNNDNGEDTFNVKFTEDGLKKYSGQNIEICYSATLNGKHGVNFDGETNTAWPEYTRAPGENVVKGEEKITYHYTFEINGNVDANAKRKNREVIKIGLDEDGQVIEETRVKEENLEWKPLAGVKFDLKNADGEVVKKVVTNADGVLEGMDKIDAGDYTLVETDLGDNKEYALDKTPIPVSIKCELDDKGRMVKYSVKVNNTLVGNYEKVYEGDEDEKGVYFLDQNGARKWKLNGEGNVVDLGTVATHSVEYDGETYYDTDSEAADIINNKVGTLPSTGGMGTVLFTIGGVAIMALALFLLFGGKKKQHQK